MITAIIPCYNSELFISRAINSVLGQTYTDWELILVDNNSTDNTLAILKQYEEKYPDQIKVFSELKKGAPAARNRGLNVAKGEWIQFLDSDDELLKTKFENQISLADQHNVDIICGGAMVQGDVNNMPKSNRKIIDIDPWMALIGSNLGITSSNLFKRSTLLKAGAWNEEFHSSQEYEMMFRMLKAGAQVKFDGEINTIIHMSDQGISRSDNADKRISIVENRIKLRLDIKDYLQTNNLLDKEKKIRIDKYIYSSLKNDEHIIPDYVKRRLGILNPKVSIFYKFAKNIQLFFLNLRRKSVSVE